MSRLGRAHPVMLGDHPLLFSAYAMGYGPAAKAITIAGRCAEAGLESAFVGHGVAYELVSRSRHVFRRIVEARPEGAAGRALIGEARVVVSVMERDAARLAVEAGRPLHVVDSLLFMRDRVPDAFVRADRYWAQRFPGVETSADSAVQPTVVGPILPALPPQPPPSGGLVVHLGGFEGNGDFSRDRHYLGLVLRALQASGVQEAQERPVRILASARTTADVRGLGEPRGVETASLAHGDALRALAAADTIVTAPGLTATLECFHLGRPVFFLPPRNYSQWCVLKTLRARGLAPHALHWEDFGERFRLGDRLPEAVRNPRVHATIDELAPTRHAEVALARLFSAAAEGEHAELRAGQHAFLRSLGGDGGRAISENLIGNRSR